MMEEGKLLPTATIIEPIPPPNDCDQKHPMLGSVRERDEARDTEDILFDSRKSSFCNGAAGDANLTQRIMDKNLKLINIILILFGVLSILFIVSISIMYWILSYFLYYLLLLCYFNKYLFMRILICYKTYYEPMKEIVKQCQRKFSEWQEEHEMFNL